MLLSAATSFTVFAAEETINRREKYGLVIKDYPELPGQEGISKIGYNFDGWYTSPQGGVKVDEKAFTVPNQEKTDLYAHWKPKIYTLTTSITNNSGSISDGKNTVWAVPAIKNLNIKDSHGNTTMVNNSSKGCFFDDYISVTPNVTSSYTTDWLYYGPGDRRRHKVRHDISVKPAQLSLTSGDAKPVFANNQFRWINPGNLKLSLVGNDSMRFVDEQTMPVRVAYGFKVNVNGTWGSGERAGSAGWDFGEQICTVADSGGSSGLADARMIISGTPGKIHFKIQHAGDVYTRTFNVWCDVYFEGRPNDPVHYEFTETVPRSTKHDGYTEASTRTRDWYYY